MLFIEQSVANKMIAEATPGMQECCGFFFGHENTINRTITRSLTVANSASGNRQTHFDISAEDYLKAERIAEDENLTFLGVYHSHPDHPAIPSDFDLERALPYFSYVIISVIESKPVKITSWQLNVNLQFKEEEIQFVQSST